MGFISLDILSDYLCDRVGVCEASGGVRAGACARDVGRAVCSRRAVAAMQAANRAPD